MKDNYKKELTIALAEYALAMNYDNMSQEAITLGKRSFIDSLGCMIAGLKEDPIKLLMEYAEDFEKPGVTPLLNGKGTRVDAAAAALIYGCAINVHDLDDISVAMNGHPSAVILSASLAVGQEIGSSGREVLEAYIVGIEIASLLGRGLCPESFHRGWHCTSTIGIFGAVTAVGKLLNLSSEQLAQGLAMAASEASGIKGNLGSETKVLHAGRAAQKGIFLARLARKGYKANLTVLEGSDGFGTITAGFFRIEKIYEAMEKKLSCFITPGIGLKVYPSCKCSFNGIDALKKVLNDNSLSYDLVDKILCYMQEPAAENMKYIIPHTKLQGKLSMPYCLAVAAVYGDVTLESFQGEEINDKRLLHLMEQVQIIKDKTLEEGYQEDTARIQVLLKDGRAFEALVEFPKGDPKNPLTDEEILGKFKASCQLGLSSSSIDKLLQKIDAFDDYINCNELLSFIEDNLA